MLGFLLVLCSNPIALAVGTVILAIGTAAAGK